ncbi:MAG: nitrous oxide reductase family maturation protein NosD [Pseudomonadota bacterium]
MAMRRWWRGQTIIPTGTILALLMVLAVISAHPVYAITSTTWQIAPGDPIQPIINQATAGDVIELQRGFYRENLRIEKPLTLRGLNRPTLSGGLQGDTVRITAQQVTIEGLIVRDSGDSLREQNAGIYLQPGAHHVTVRNCDLTYNLFGIWIENADDVVIDNNIITGKRDYRSSQRGNGIQLYNSQRARITTNNISFVRDGIYIDVSHHAVFSGNRLHHSRYGSHYMNSYYNLWEGNDSWMNRGGLALMEVRDQVVRNNRAWANSDHGIMLRTIQNARVENNIVAGNARGFFIYDAEYNTLQDNLVVDNVVGVHLWAGSKNNRVEGNDFISNREPVRYVGAKDEAWGTERGNHWSNYLGWDRNGDNRGDIQYEANDIVDRLTWKHPMMKLLLASPAVQSLRLVGQQFPVLRAPSVIDPNPQMRPSHPNWRDWLGKHYPGFR